ncbi:MAG: nicotinate phosphoribosyltransferase [Verrucomicrobiae bacterium]|nr:nicotinate phosphoribosyltransferase [Verrucomicrobiae bacterium]
MKTSPLNTDLYELTMMAGLHRHAKLGDTATFDLYFRRVPFQGGFAIAAGLETALDALEGLRFEEEEIAYLSAVGGEPPLFDRAFLDWLRDQRFRGEIWGVPEGTVVFQDEPLLRVSGSLAECMLVETMLLCILNFQTLIATKAARLWEASHRGSVIEFGLRRAQGLDGGLSAARAAYIGGADGTSNLRAGKAFGIPVRGTQSHAWVLSFPTELTAFRAFAETFPGNVILLVDTYDVVRSGVPNAIMVAREMRARGQALRGIRIDSGDLAYLSRIARQMLDEAGFPEVKIVASNDIEELVIEEIIRNGGRVDIWGVGTNLVTGGGAGGTALGGVFKMVEINGHPVIKLSDSLEKGTSPGRKQVWRLLANGGAQYEADALALENEAFAPGRDVLIIDPRNPLRRKRIAAITSCEPLLRCVMREGKRTGPRDTLDAARDRRVENLDRLDSSHKRLVNPHVYKVGVTQALWRLKEELLNLQTT